MVPLASFLRLKTSVDVEPVTAEDRALLLVDQGKHAADPFLRRTLLVRAAEQLDNAVREEAEEMLLARFEAIFDRMEALYVYNEPGVALSPPPTRFASTGADPNQAKTRFSYFLRRLQTQAFTCDQPRALPCLPPLGTPTVFMGPRIRDRDAAGVSTPPSEPGAAPSTGTAPATGRPDQPNKQQQAQPPPSAAAAPEKGGEPASQNAESEGDIAASFAAQDADGSGDAGATPETPRPSAKRSPWSSSSFPSCLV